MAGIMIAGTHSGCGKTTVILGLLAALKKKGLEVQSFKTGPDFIDSGLHRMITGRPSRNLDLWMCGEEYVRACYRQNSADADIAVVEGVMGLYDGSLSTASLASSLDLRVILVVDGYGMAETAGALVKGIRDWGLGIGKKTDPETPTPKPYIAGVIFNRVASENHYKRLCAGVCDSSVLGYLPRDLEFEISHRHLGLTVAEENPMTKENIDKLADAVLNHIDLDMVVEISRERADSLLEKSLSTSFCQREAIPSLAKRGERRFFEKKFERQSDSASELEILHASHLSHSVVAVAYDRAFCFYYEDNLDLLRDEGAEISFFSPLADPAIPEYADAVYIGGGYPELYAEELSKNTSMCESIRKWADSGRPLYAECGGLMYLSRGISDFDGRFFAMAGVFSFETRMKKGRSKLGYREVSLKEDCIVGKKGAKLKGHEFHYSEIADAEGSPVRGIYSVNNGSHEKLPDEGYRYNKTLVSYIHLHFGSNSGIAREFINNARERGCNET
jgi:cobyrinic acid a,c-diamide synthase